MVDEALSSGRYHDVDAFLDEALSTWRTSEDRRHDLKRAQAA